MKLSSIISAFSKHRDNDTKPSDHKIDNIDYPNAPAAQVLIDSGIAKAKCMQLLPSKLSLTLYCVHQPSWNEAR
jgi:hypothetical protein